MGGGAAWGLGWGLGKEENLAACGHHICILLHLSYS